MPHGLDSHQWERIGVGGAYFTILRPISEFFNTASSSSTRLFFANSWMTFTTAKRGRTGGKSWTRTLVGFVVAKLWPDAATNY